MNAVGLYALQDAHLAKCAVLIVGISLIAWSQVNAVDVPPSAVITFADMVLVLTGGGCTTIAYHRTGSYFDLALALARGLNTVQRSVVQEEVMFLWAQVALRFGKT